MCWQPYFTGLGWDPFMNGAWMWYPGWGYTWVSGYPWGWLPYRYGSWRYAGSYGWLWSPGGRQNGWAPAPVIVGAPPTYRAPQPPVVRPTLPPPGTTITAN